MATVNLTTNDYASQLAAIARRQKYAELLAQQGAEAIDVQSVGGIPTPISPFQGLAKVLKSGMGAYLGRKAGEDEAEATAAEKNAVEEERARIFGMNPAVAATPLSQGAYQGVDAEGIPSYDVNLPTKAKAASYVFGPEDQMNALYKLGGRSDMGARAAATGIPQVMRRLERADAQTDLAAKQAYDDKIREAALKLEAERFAIGQTRQATQDAESARRFGLTQAANAAGRVPTMRFVTVDGPDGKPKRVMMSDAQIVSAQAGGANVSDTTVKALPRLTSQQFIKLGESLTADINSANRLKGYMSDAKDIPQGFKLIAQDFANKFTTAFGGTLTGDALKVAMQQGTLQSLIGNLRIETVGGGVMTEQDALRVIQALGGDLGMLRNKDVVEGQIRKILESKEARIKQNMQFYNRDAESQGVSQMEYGSPSAGSAYSNLTDAQIKAQLGIK